MYANGDDPNNTNNFVCFFNESSQTRTLSGGGATVARVQFGVDFSGNLTIGQLLRLHHPHRSATDGAERSVATSVIKTTDTAITQPADVITAIGVSGDIGQTEGAVLVEVDLRNPKQESNGIIALTSAINNDGTNRVAITKGDSKTIGLGIRANDTLVVSIFTVSEWTNGINKIGVRYKSGESAMYVNGVLVGTSVNNFTFTQVLNNVKIGYFFGFPQFFTMTNKPYQIQTSAYQISTEAELLEYIESLTGSTEQYASNLAEGIHCTVQLGQITEVDATFDDEGNILTEAVLSERYHADILTDRELTLPNGITRHFPTQPKHGFA
jgi:hypothetical protein